MLILGFSKRSGHMPVVLRVVILGTLLQGIDFAQTPATALICTVSNGIATGFFGGVDADGYFTSGATPDTSSLIVSGGSNSAYAYSYTFTGPLNGAGYLQTSQIPLTPCILEGCTPSGPGQAGLHVVPNGPNTSAALLFEDTGEVFIGSGTLSCTTATPLSPSQVTTTASGLAHSRVTQLFSGTITLTNVSGSAISGPFQVLFVGITGAVTLVNATGYLSGTPYLTVPTSLAPGQAVTVSVVFSNPTNALINFTPQVFAGSLP